LLNGGLPKWLSEGRDTTEGVESNPVGDFTGTPDNNMMVTTDEVKAMLGSKVNAIIDARAPERFRGEVEPIDTVAGRIPGAVNRFYNDNLDKNGLFLPAESLKTAFATLLNGFMSQPDRHGVCRFAFAQIICWLMVRVDQGCEESCRIRLKGQE